MDPKPGRAVFLIAFGHLMVELCGNYLPVLYPILIETLNLSYTQIGAIALATSAATTFPQPISGYLSDRWRPHRLVTLSIVWIGVTMGLVGLTWSYGSLLLLVALGGLGSAVFHPPSAVVASTGGGSGRRGAAMSVFSVSGNVGTALSPLLMTASIAWLGLRGTTVLIPVGLLAALLLHPHLRESADLVADQPDAPLSPTKNGVRIGLLLVVLAVMARSWFQVSLMTYLPTWIESQRGSVTAGGQMLFLLMIAVGFGSLTGGALSDRIGRWQVLALSMALLGPAHWLFVSGSGALQVILLGMIGFLMGASFPVAIVMAQETSPRNVGMVSGLVIGLGWLPGGVGASVTGFIADHFSLTVGLQTLILLPIVGVVCSLVYAARQRSESVVSTRPEPSC